MDVRRALLVGVLLCLSAPGFSRDLEVGITGHTTLRGWENPVTLLRREAVQAAVLAIAEGPRDRAEIEAMLGTEPFDVNALIDARVLAERGDRLYINFNLMTAADAPVLHRIRERHGRLLADELVERWDAIDSALDRYGLERVPRNVLAYILLGVFSLDWDGLTLTAERGWREVAQPRPNGDVFHLWAEERPDPTALRGLFWGSHNDAQGDLRLTTFGDHYALPRIGFPDLAWQMQVSFRHAETGFEKTLNPGSIAAARDGILGRVAAVMLLLRDGRQSTDAIAERLGRPADQTGQVMEMLKAIGYIAEIEQGWVSRVPVLDDRDVDMTRAVLMTGREAMLDWAADHIGEVFTDMEDLVSVRQGVAPEAMMTQVWHHIFAAANAALIAKRYLADPYEKPQAFAGFFPAVWTAGNDPDTLVAAARTTTRLH